MTQEEVARAIVSQLRLLDPSISAEIGTPERKIIDVVAQQVAERSVDLNQLEGALDIDAKFGEDLDNFLGLFRFARQQGSFATSFATFSRPSPSTYDIPIPNGTVVTANINEQTDDFSPRLLFQTTQTVVLTKGELSVVAPVRATRVGEIGNIAVGEINGFGPSTIAGITEVTNEIVGRGGVDPEDDVELKARFKNTVFRNVSGTHDQYLADALSAPNMVGNTKANVVGPISRYIESIQVPAVPDSQGGNGKENEWTSALSSVPYSKYTYENSPAYVIDDQISETRFGIPSIEGYFLRPEVDYVVNTSAIVKNKGDAFRQNSVFDDLSQIAKESIGKPNVTFKNVLPSNASKEIFGLRPGKILLFEHSYMSEASRNDAENGILNCVDVFVNGVKEEYADVVMPIPSLSDAFVNNPSSIRHYNNFRRYGEPTNTPVVGNLFQPLFSQPAIRLPSAISVGDNTFLEGVHYWMVQDATELGGTVRARNGIEWNPRIPGRSSGDTSSDNFTGESILALSAIENALEQDQRVLEIESYTYNENIGVLQGTLEGNKQVTTDVLAHEAKMRYFKVDVALMYTSGYSQTTVNDQISKALADFFQSLYFGSYVQLSDVLSIIRQVSGVDNARWSIDVLRDDPAFTGDLSVPVDSNGQPRWPIVECDMNGRPLTRVVTDRVQQGFKSTDDEAWQEAKDYTALSKVTKDGFYWYALENINPADPGPVPEPGVSPKWRKSIPAGAQCIDRVYLTGEPTGGTFVLSYEGFSADQIDYVDEPDTIIGFGPPSDDIGNIGSTYYDKLNQKIWRSKTANGWTNPPEAWSSTQAIDMSFPYGATAEDIERKLREQAGDFVSLTTQTSLKVTGSGTSEDPWEIRWNDIGPRPKLLALSGLWGNYSWDTDFPLKDNELATIPNSVTNLDSAAGLIVRAKAQNTWNQV